MLDSFFRLAARLLKALLWLLVSLVLLASVSWGLVHWFIVPRIDDLRPRFEQLASRALGAKVAAGRIEAVSNGLIPVITLHDVTVQSQQGPQDDAPDLRAPRVLAAFSVRSLLRASFEQLVIDGAQIELRRRTDGRLLVAGLDVSGDAAAADTRAADWFFSQPELLLQGGLVRWVDETRDAPPVTLSDVYLLFRNGHRSHDVQLQATPQKQWGDRFTLAGRFRQPLLSLHAGQWRQWHGQAYADLPRVDVAQLRRYVNAGDWGMQGLPCQRNAPGASPRRPGPDPRPLGRALRPLLRAAAAGPLHPARRRQLSR